ncbi:conserved hypothetical protein [Burkholderia vietnamiensis]
MSSPYSYSSNGLPALDPNHRSFATVRHFTEIPQDYARIDAFLSERGIRPLANARYGLQRNVVQRFLDGEIPENDAGATALAIALVDLAQMWAVISTYRELRKLPADLRTAFFSDPVELSRGGPSKGRDALMEYYAGARFKAAGCSIRKAEPDIVCQFRSVEFGLAVKRFKIDNLEQHVRKARRQIENTGRGGVIVLDVTQSNPTLSAPVGGTVDGYRTAMLEWMEEHFYQPLRRNWQAWGLDRRKVPYVVCFNHGVFFGDDGGVYRMSQMYNFVTDPVSPPSISESAMIYAVHEAVEAVRATLPEAAP